METVTVIAYQAVPCSKPHEAVPVLLHIGYMALHKSVCRRKVALTAEEIRPAYSDGQKKRYEKQESQCSGNCMKVRSQRPRCYLKDKSQRTIVYGKVWPNKQKVSYDRQNVIRSSRAWSRVKTDIMHGICISA